MGDGSVELGREHTNFAVMEGCDSDRDVLGSYRHRRLVPLCAKRGKFSAKDREQGTEGTRKREISNLAGWGWVFTGAVGLTRAWVRPSGETVCEKPENPGKTGNSEEKECFLCIPPAQAELGQGTPGTPV
jgi:hypothetical protein